MSLLRTGYQALSWASSPFVCAYLKWRAFKGYEDIMRLSERRGISNSTKPPKLLLWLHAVSVGEALSGLTIIQAILKRYPDVHALLTTTTVSSSTLVGKKLPRSTTHQYCPVDTPQAVRRFLETWQPDLAIWVESELWPNLMHFTQERGIPTLLLNGRMSSRSFSSWKKLRGIISPLLARLELCAVQTQEQAHHFEELGAKNVSVMGNVKVMLSPQEINQENYIQFKKSVEGRPIWLAASTHPGEESIVLKAHKALLKNFPNLLTVIVPRHIQRAQEIQKLVAEEGLTSVLRSHSQSPEKSDVYIGDTLGELGIFYALSPVVFMGATLIPKGGHNPIEAAQMNAFVLHGPHTFNNPQLYEALERLNLCQAIQDDAQLAECLLPFLKEKKSNFEEPKALQTFRQEGLQNLMDLLEPHLKHLRRERA